MSGAIVGDIDRNQLGRRLGDVDLPIRLGPMVVRVGIMDAASVENFAHLYGRHQVAAADEPPDFTFTLHRQRGGRWRNRPYGRMELDGVPLTKPFEWRYAWPMFEWGLHYAVSRRGGFALMLHAAVVARDGKALVLPAHSGSGKSTLAALLVAAGWQFVSDEFLVLRRDGSSLSVYPLPQPIALKGASLDIVGPHFPQSEWSQVWPHASKGTIRYLRPQAVDPGFVTGAGWILLPEFVPDAPVTISPLQRKDAFLAIGPTSFTYHWRGVDGFRDSAQFVRESRCASMTFGDGPAAVEAIDAWTREQ